MNPPGMYDSASRKIHDRLPKGLTDAVKIAVAVADTIRELGEIPAGTLYAVLMTRMSHHDFEQLMGILVSAGLVKRSASHLLTWIGPAAEAAQ